MNRQIRFWEIDFLRGIAIIMMIVFHVLFDLSYFAGMFSMTAEWQYLAYVTATLFLILVGISLSLSYSRAQFSNKINILQRTNAKGVDAICKISKGKNLFIKYLKRGLMIFSLGLIITITTFILFAQNFIIFGILHLIGLSIILAYPLIRYCYLNLILGALFIMLGIILKSITVNFPWLLWLGIKPAFTTFDYFPLLPWFGVVLVGIFVGNSLYPKYTRIFRMPEISNAVAKPFKKLLCFLGRHSLIIYLAHQLIIIALLQLFGVINLFI
jgi:uncharacterized membrane protein